MIEGRIKNLRDFTQVRGFRAYRSFLAGDYRSHFTKLRYNFSKRNAEILRIMCDAEDTIVFPNERIAFTRTKLNVPWYYDDKYIKKTYHPQKGVVYDVFHNICPDYSILLNYGLENRLNLARELLDGGTVKQLFVKILSSKLFSKTKLPNLLKKRKVNALFALTKNKTKRKFLEAVVTSLEAVLKLAERYSLAAKALGNAEIENIMRNVPRMPAASFHEALQSIRILSAAFYLADTYQLGFGRMDQYLYPFYEKDIDEKKITREGAKALLAEFFISLNRDTDLYFGIQQGDNGQSLVLGGCKRDGTSAINALTYLILEVSRDLRLIDPKINLRIDSQTPDDLLELGCELTRCGLGFPQYSNDEVVIPALVKKGYDLQDARDYTVAACWEFIIPGKGMDVVNQGAVSFPAAVDRAFSKTLKSFSFTMGVFRKNIKKDIRKQICNLLKKRDIKILPSPLVSVFMDNALESQLDASVSAKYHNIGIHGSGSSNGADALTCIRLTYEKEGIEGLKKLEDAKNKNFYGYEALRLSLLNEMPKVGNSDDTVDRELKFLFDSFADCADEFSTKNRRIRAGSGSAMYYVWLADSNNKRLLEPTVRATADGRLDGEALSTSLAPSQGIRVNGVVSVLKSFANIDYSRIMNGGPITIELTPSVFNSNDGIKKLSQLIRYFVKLGNQQLQLNVLDAETLKDAVKNPDKYRNLIVRVWGWSGYFCELAPEYQQHIIHRHQYEL
jgi:formate C-acetyltransferase